MHYQALAVVDAALFQPACDRAGAWMREVRRGKYDGVLHGAVAEGASGDAVAQAGTERFKVRIKQAALAERELAKQAWRHVNALVDAHGHRADPPDPRDKYVLDIFEHFVLHALDQARMLHSLGLHDRDPRAFSALGRLYDLRTDRSVHLLELPPGSEVFAVTCDFLA